MTQKCLVAQLSVLAPIAVQRVFGALLQEFTLDRAVRVRTDFDMNRDIARRLTAGEAVDIAMTLPDYVADLIAAGLVHADTHAPFGRVPLALARSGMPPAGMVNDETSVVAMLETAQSIAYADGSISGDLFLGALELLGLRDKLAGRLRPMPTGEPLLSAAAGHSDLAVAPMSTVAAAAGVREWAAFPSHLGTDIEMSMVVTSQAKDVAQARKVIGYLAHPRNDWLLSDAGLMRFRLR